MDHVYVAFNSRPDRGKPYLAIGSMSWSAQRARDFMGDAKEWRRLSRGGWKIIKYTLPVPKGRKVVRAHQ